MLIILLKRLDDIFYSLNKGVDLNVLKPIKKCSENILKKLYSDRNIIKNYPRIFSWHNIDKIDLVYKEIIYEI